MFSGVKVYKAVIVLLYKTSAMKKIFKTIILFLISGVAYTQSTTLIPYGSNWKYLDNGSNQGSAWYGTTFNDAAWSSGNAELGYGDGDEATVVSYGPSSTAKYITTYFRKVINTPTASSFLQFTMNLRRDDGIVVYINGAEVYRNNMPAGAPAFTTGATIACIDDGGTVLTTTLAAGTLTNGNNLIAAEIHQNNGTSSDITFEFELIGVTSIPPASLVKGPYLQIGTQNSMILRWETNIATDTKVAYGTSSVALTSSVSNPAVSTTHSIQVTGLSPLTKYYYSIGTTTAVIQSGADNYFLTSPVPGTEGPYRFWVTGDCGNSSTNQTNCKNQYLAFTGTTVTNGWLLLGDNAYSSGTNGEFNSEFFAYYQNDIMKKAVLWPAPGNHDYSNGASTATTVPYYSIFSTPKNAEAGGQPSGNPAYYSYDYGNIHFLSLDSYGTVGSMKMYDTTGAQTLWIKNDLAANTKKWVVAYWHHPPYTMGSHNSDSEGDLVNIHTRFIRILERMGVDLILCGHSHDYERSKLMTGHYGNEASFSAVTHHLSSSSALYDGSANSCPYLKDSVNVKKGTVYVVAGSAGQLGGTQGSFPHNSMYYSNATQGGSLVLDFNANRLDAKWVCADGVIRDKFTMFKDVNRVKTFTVTPTQTTNISASWPGTFLWNNAATSQSISVTTSVNTTFWVKDPNNCVADTFKFVMAGLPPTANFGYTGPYCEAVAVSFNDMSTSSPTSWSWSVTPSAGVTISSPTSQNPNITFNTAGIYTVTQQSINSFGSGTISKTLTINSLPPVTAVSNPTTGIICIGSSITLSGNGANTYTWSGGITDAVAFSPTVSATYSVLGTDLNGCKNIAARPITVNPLPTVTAISNPTSGIICSGAPITLSGSGAISYTWTGGITNAAPFSPTTSASYTVTGTDANGCQNTAIKSITVNNLPGITISSTPVSAVICLGNSVTLSGNGANTYTWTGGISDGVAFSPTVSATYSVTGMDANGCQNTTSQAVTVNSLPTISANTTNSLMCVGQTVTITASGATSYVWNTSATTTAIAVSPTITTTYSVTGTDANNCVNSTSFTQSVSTCAGITAFTQNHHINVYPNPNHGIFTIEMNVNGDFEIETYNVIGELIHTTKLQTGSNTIDLKTKPGIYYYNVLDNKKIIHQGKLIVE